MRLAVVVPMYNEEAGAQRCVTAISQILRELPRDVAALVVVDDGSTDHTLMRLNASRPDDVRVEVVAKARNEGYGAALRAGADHAGTIGAEWVLFMDSDLTNPPLQVRDFLETMTPDVDVIKACRYCSGGRMVDIPLRRRVFSKIGNVTARLLGGGPHRDPTNGFRAFRTDSYLRLPLTERGFSVILEELYHARRFGLRGIDLPTELRRPLHGSATEQLQLHPGTMLGLPTLAVEDCHRSPSSDPASGGPVTGPDIMVLGATGMLGSMVVRVLSEEFGPSRVVGTQRGGSEDASGGSRRSIRFDAVADDPGALLAVRPTVGWAINAVGQTKPHIDERSPTSRRRAIELNALLPHRLAEAAEHAGVRVLTIATDGVFSGTCGPFTESTGHEPCDLYGSATKSIGEVVSNHVMHLRTSIIGLEQGSSHSLLGWLLGQPDGATIRGYGNHLWNGVTTLHFARIVAGIIRRDDFEPGVHHVVPADAVSKFELLTLLADAFERTTIVLPSDAPTGSDRRLATNDPTSNLRRWESAGYPSIPAIRDAIIEFAEYVRDRDLLP